MKNDAPRSGRASTVVLVVLLLTAAIVTAGLFFLVKYTVDDGFDLHLDFSKIPAHADVVTPQPTELPAEPETMAPAWPMVLPSGAVKPAT